MFEIVKEGDNRIELNSIAKGSYRAYCYENDAVVSDFLAGYDITELVQEDCGFLRERYNPLLIRQDIFLVNEELVYQIPYLLVKYRDKLSLLTEKVNELKKDNLLYPFMQLLYYLLTKDFLYLNQLIKSGDIFALSALSHLSKAIHVNGLDMNQIEQAIHILQGEQKDGTQVFGEYLKRNQAYLSKSTFIYDKIKKEKKKKNIILIHLESLSTEIYYNKLHYLPTLTGLISRSLYLNQYYSTASSSCMSLTDILFGNDFENDAFTVFDRHYLTNCYCKNLYAILAEQGYQVLGIGHNEVVEEINRYNLWNIAGAKYQWKADYQEFEDGVRDFIMDTEEPFAMHIWNLMTHIGHNDEDTYQGSTYMERMDISYTSLDMTIKLILEALQTRGIVDDTVIIGYGDHGDDKWTRSLNYGCTHIIPPYLNLIKTPAFIFDTRIEPQLFQDIVSGVDIKNTALFLAGIDEREEFPYQGINIFEKKNEFAYARSLLANQRLDEKIEADWVCRLNNFSDIEHKNKSFSVINKNYQLLVSNDGIEFFMHGIDSAGYNNLLDFFELDEEGNIKKFNNHGAWRGHFRNVLMADDQIYDILYNYHILKEELIKRIHLKNKMVREKEQNFFNMELLRKVRKRGFIW